MSPEAGTSWEPQYITISILTKKQTDTNLPAVKLLRMLLPHNMETMCNGGILRERIKS